MSLFKNKKAEKKAEKNPEPIRPEKSQYQITQEKVAGPFPEELLITKRLGFMSGGGGSSAAQLNYSNPPAYIDYSVAESFGDHMVPCAPDTITRIAVYKLVRVDKYVRETVKVSK